jgi:integrase
MTAGSRDPGVIPEGLETMGRAKRPTPPEKKLTSAVVRAKREGKRIVVSLGDRHSPGLAARIGPTGDISWVLRYRQQGGRQVAITFEAESISAAREHARDVLAKARRATVGAEADPWEARQREREEEQRRKTIGGDTVGELITRYLEDAEERLAPSTLVGYRSILKSNVLPALGKMRPAEVERAHVRALVDRVRREGHDTHANRVLASCKALFSWALEKDHLKVHPCAGLKASKEKPNERVYTDDELRAILAAARGTEVEHLVPLVLLTACRPGEARAARWEDVDTERKLWTIRATDTKGGTRPLPLTDAALAALPPKGDSEFLFPAPTSGGYMDPPQKSIVLIRERSGVDVGRLLHTLRTTARTHIAKLGTPADIGERILGHVPSKIRGAYDHFDYVPQMRTALEAWAREVERIVKDEERRDNVVPMVGRSW